jgi:hypothetical protein
MNTLTHLLESLINAFTRSRGTDVFVGLNEEPDSLFSFTYKKTGVDRVYRNSHHPADTGAAATGPGTGKVSTPKSRRSFN